MSGASAQCHKAIFVKRDPEASSTNRVSAVFDDPLFWNTAGGLMWNVHRLEYLCRYRLGPLREEHAVPDHR